MIRINRLARTTFDLFAIFKQIVEPRLNFVHCRVTMQIAAALSRPGFGLVFKERDADRFPGAVTSLARSALLIAQNSISDANSC